MTDHATALSRPDGTQEALAGFPAGVAWIDGAYVSMAEARIPVLDWGFLRSDATYDVVHVWKGKFFRLDAHIERFLSSIDKLRSEEHTSELQSRGHLVCRLLLEK